MYRRDDRQTDRQTDSSCEAKGTTGQHLGRHDGQIAAVETRYTAGTNVCDKTDTFEDGYTTGQRGMTQNKQNEGTTRQNFMDARQTAVMIRIQEKEMVTRNTNCEDREATKQGDWDTTNNS
ncbi:hypothetical protein E2C01_043757 [Portunus trituberculatus]|uniref:Uncharacterized protein n=1 Tax=Portunus trituberculatus TaxID=210409 RepID=A0A5B7FTT1_PORTR|nr:hypothetical protein [Portunus trituberculatus]